MNNEIIVIKKTDDYNLYSLPYVTDHHSDIIISAHNAHEHFKDVVGDIDSTRSYDQYNIFSLCAGDHYFYTIYKCIVAAVRDRVGDNRPLWMQSWLNYHREDNVLGWHDHTNDYLVHGYLSIDPKVTATEFRKFTIDNRIGNLYVGNPGNGMEHRVVVKEPYNGYRITIAFDVIDFKDKIATNLSFIPI